MNPTRLYILEQSDLLEAGRPIKRVYSKLKRRQFHRKYLKKRSAIKRKQKLYRKSARYRTTKKRYKIKMKRRSYRPVKRIYR